MRPLRKGHLLAESSRSESEAAKWHKRAQVHKPWRLTMGTSTSYRGLALLFILNACVSAQQTSTGGCGVGQPSFAGDWAREGVRVTLEKTGDDVGNSCSRNVILEMVDELRFHSNPWVESLAVIVQFPPSAALVIPYEIGKRVYNITLQLPQLPCTASGSCADFIGGICQQQGVGFFYQMRMTAGCPGANEFLGIRDGETFDAPNWRFAPDPTEPCMPGNAANYDNIDEGIQDIVANLLPHPTLAGSCVWRITTSLAAGPRFRDSDYLDMISFRGAGASNYGAGFRLFFKGQPQYVNLLPGPASCADTMLDVELVLLNEFLGAFPNYVTGVSTCPFNTFTRYQLNRDQHYSFAGTGGTTGGSTGSSPSPSPAPTVTPSPSPAPVITPSPSPAPIATPSPSPAPTVTPSPAPATCTAPALPQGAVGPVALINAGGPALCNYFTADTAASQVAVGGVADDWVFRDPACPPGSQNAACSVRFGSTFSYTIPTIAGRSYTLRFTFSEVYWGAAGQRRFDVLVGGAAVLTNVDPYELAGRKFTPVERDVTVTATGPTLVVSMLTRVDNAALAALEVFDMGVVTTPVNPSPSPAPIVSPSPSPAPIVNPSPSPSPIVTPSPSPAPVITPSPSPSPIVTPSPSPSPIITPSPSPAPIVTPSPSPSPIITPSPSPAPIVTPSPSPSPIISPSPSPRPVITPSPALATCTVPALPQGAVGPVALINAGGPALCNYFRADTAVSPVATGGVADDWVSRDPACPPGSQNAACSVRFGGTFSYTIPTVAGRSYMLRFTCSEVWWGAAGQRRFDVLVGGAAVLTNVDPYELAGRKYTPVERDVTVTATGPTLVVSMLRRVDNAALAALEVFDMGIATTPITLSPSPAPIITPSPSPSPIVTLSPSPAPIVTPSPAPATCTVPALPQGAVGPVALINAGGPALCNYFTADTAASQVAVGGIADNWVFRNPACPPGSQNAACSVRFGGTFSYTIPTVAGRSYMLRFTFSEVWWGAAGQRRFDVLVGGAAVLTNVDPYELAGRKFTPVEREVTVTATGPTLVISMLTRVDNAALAALEVFDMGVAIGSRKMM